MNKFDFDISKLSEYSEDNCLEVKNATKGLLNSIWRPIRRLLIRKVD